MKKLTLVSAACIAAASVACLLCGCATGQPASKQQTIKAYDNTVTLTMNIYRSPGRSAKSAGAEAETPPLNIYISDVLGTQAADASAGTSDSTQQTAAPQLAAGLTGDKPVEAASETAKTAITGGASAAADSAADLAKKAAAKLKDCGTTNCADVASADCAAGSCADKK